MTNRRFEMYHYRQILVRMRLGDSDREIARSKTMGWLDAHGLDAAVVRRFAGDAALAPSLDVLMGVEGAAAARYFGLWATTWQEPWHFPGRNRRPPPRSGQRLAVPWVHTRAEPARATSRVARTGPVSGIPAHTPFRQVSFGTRLARAGAALGGPMGLAAAGQRGIEARRLYLWSRGRLPLGQIRAGCVLPPLAHHRGCLAAPPGPPCHADCVDTCA